MNPPKMYKKYMNKKRSEPIPLTQEAGQILYE